MHKKDKFIAKHAPRIFAAMFAHPEKVPNAKNAVLEAEALWSELEKKDYCQDNDGVPCDKKY